MQILMKRPGKIDSEPTALVSCFGKAKPRLLDFRKAIPGPEHWFTDVARLRLVSKEHEILNHLIVELSILYLLAVDQKKWIYEQRQIGDQRDVKGTMLLQGARINV